MKKIIIAPDSFKGTMSSVEVSDIIKTTLSKTLPDCTFYTIPIADGGEGTVECLLKALEGEKIFVDATDAFGHHINGFYGKFGELAVVEMAAVAGMVSNKERNPMIASTYGVGQLINKAIKDGCKKIMLGLGGSCTNDAGAGMAAAIGTIFYDVLGESFVPVGGNLDKVAEIDNRITEEKLKDVQITCMCDITLCLYGKNGAAYIFAPQKGASNREVEILDNNLKVFSNTIERCLEKDVSTIEGGAAAGGMGAGAVAFLNAKLKRGIDVILDAVNFDELAINCDMVITGEGKIDNQSLSGKVVSGITHRAKNKGLQVVVIAGMLDDPIDSISPLGFDGLYITTSSKVDFDEIKATCRENLVKSTTELAEDIKTGKFLNG